MKKKNVNNLSMLELLKLVKTYIETCLEYYEKENAPKTKKEKHHHVLAWVSYKYVLDEINKQILEEGLDKGNPDENKTSS